MTDERILKNDYIYRIVPLKPKNIDIKKGICRSGGMKDFKGLTPCFPMSA